MGNRAPGAEPIYQSAARWVEVGLSEDGSLFTPGIAVWTAENIEGLVARIAETGGLLAAQRRNHDVGGCRKPLRLTTVPGLPQIDLQRALAAQPERRVRKAAERVSARGLDLDDVGPEVAEDHRCHPSHGPQAEVEDAEALERGRHVSALPGGH
jgi:hypothetical protein